ncbi:Uncharacterised protein [Mycobacteroides abscessus subsp. abscessus]|nr:Uncharacterised protein [Mycobacteroides abscessus subsp. abscessus]
MDLLESACFDLAPGVDDVGVILREVRRHDAEVERRLAPGGHLTAGHDGLTGLAQLVECRQPGVDGVDVSALPRGQRCLRLKIDQVDVLRVHTGVVECGEQTVVRGRCERRRHALALEVGDRIDPGSVARHQRLVVARDVEDERDLVGNVQRRGESARHGARTDCAEVDLLRDERRVDVGA